MICGVQSNMEPLIKYFVSDQTIYSYDELIDELIAKGYTDSEYTFEEVLELEGIRTFDNFEDASEYLDELAIEYMIDSDIPV